MQLSIIIVNYNVRHFLEQALLSIRRASAGINIEVFVVDNNSVDESVQMVKFKFPEVRLIVNKANLGYAKANNLAIKQATGKFILLLNPDTVIEEDTLSKCLEFMEDNLDAGALGVKMIDGSGEYLPESKRGFPTPLVAFFKAFGLARLFPRSRLFNRYYLGHLNPDEINEIEVLAGAFMMIRRKVLDEIGLLDESFFMYGEDIDLSFRITQAGYKNYYFPDTTIIHYKGESTKKGSLNYVRVFYKAMLIFAKKHFQGSQASWYILMLQIAIYFRASVTLLSNVFRVLALPIVDGILIFAGLLLLKNFWEVYYFNDSDYYDSLFVYFNAPLYTLIWIGTVYFSGGYDDRRNVNQLIKGVLLGTLILAAIYGFLDLAYRSSRMLILLGAVWAIFSMLGTRAILHFIKYNNFNIVSRNAKNLIIVGNLSESERVRNLLLRAEVPNNFIGVVFPGKDGDKQFFLSDLSQLDEVVRIYRVDEVIFCSKDVSAQEIMKWMNKLGHRIEFKIVPEESLSIIGSSSKNSSGELYTIDIQFQITNPIYKRYKLLFDIFVSVTCIAIYPILVFGVNNPLGLLKNVFLVIAGRKSWVGYSTISDEVGTSLPDIRPGVLSPLVEFRKKKLDLPTVHRLNLLYAKDYTPGKDLEIVLRGWRSLGD